MGLIVTNVRTQRSLGSGVTTLSEDIKFDFTAHNLELDVYMLKNLTSAATTMAKVYGKLTQTRLETTNSQPESTIDTVDWHDFLVAALYLAPYQSASVTTQVDNQEIAFGLQMPLSPYSNDPTMNYGLPPGKGTQFTADWAADDATVDTGTYNLNVNGVTADLKPNPIGYVRFIRDSYTAVAGSDRFTTISGSGVRLLGVHNFGTTSFDDLTTGAFDTTSIRQQQIQFSNNTVAGPIRPERGWVYQYLPLITATPQVYWDNGSFFWDLGINNRAGAPGIDISGGQTVQVKTTGGAADTVRVNPVVLAR